MGSKVGNNHPLQSRESLAFASEKVLKSSDDLGNYLVGQKNRDKREIDGVARGDVTYLSQESKRHDWAAAAYRLSGRRKSDYEGARNYLKDLSASILSNQKKFNNNQILFAQSIDRVLRRSKSKGCIKLDETLRRELNFFIADIKTEAQKSVEAVTNDCSRDGGNISHFLGDVERIKSGKNSELAHANVNKQGKANVQLLEQIILVNTSAKTLELQSQTVNRLKLKPRSFTAPATSPAGEVTGQNLLDKIAHWPGSNLQMKLAIAFDCANFDPKYGSEVFKTACKEVLLELAEQKYILRSLSDDLLNTIEDKNDRDQLRSLRASVEKLLVALDSSDSPLKRLEDLALAGYYWPEETAQTVVKQRREFLLGPIPTDPAPLPVVNGQPVPVNGQLPPVHPQPVPVYAQPLPGNGQPVPVNAQPVPVNGPLAAGNGQPQSHANAPPLSGNGQAALVAGSQPAPGNLAQPGMAGASASPGIVAKRVAQFSNLSPHPASPVSGGAVTPPLGGLPSSVPPPADMPPPPADMPPPPAGMPPPPADMPPPPADMPPPPADMPLPPADMPPPPAGMPPPPADMPPPPAGMPPPPADMPPPPAGMPPPPADMPPPPAGMPPPPADMPPPPAGMPPPPADMPPPPANAGQVSPPANNLVPASGPPQPDAKLPPPVHNGVLLPSDEPPPLGSPMRAPREATGKLTPEEKAAAAELTRRLAIPPIPKGEPPQLPDHLPPPVLNGVLVPLSSLQQLPDREPPPADQLAKAAVDRLFKDPNMSAARGDGNIPPPPSSAAKLLADLTPSDRKVLTVSKVDDGTGHRVVTKEGKVLFLKADSVQEEGGLRSLMNNGLRGRRGAQYQNTKKALAALLEDAELRGLPAAENKELAHAMPIVKHALKLGKNGVEFDDFTRKHVTTILSEDVKRQQNVAERQHQISTRFAQSKEPQSKNLEAAIDEFAATNGSDFEKNEKDIFFKKLGDHIGVVKPPEQTIDESSLSSVDQWNYKFIKSVDHYTKLTEEMKKITSRPEHLKKESAFYTLPPSFYGDTLSFVQKNMPHDVGVFPENIVIESTVIFAQGLVSQVIQLIGVISEDDLARFKGGMKEIKRISAKAFRQLDFLTRLFTNEEYLAQVPTEGRALFRQYGEALQQIALGVLDPQGPYIAFYRMAEAAETSPETAKFHFRKVFRLDEGENSADAQAGESKPPSKPVPPVPNYPKMEVN